MTDGHPDPMVLAEHDEGLLDPSHAVEVEVHLAQCPSCSEILERLGEVRNQLADAPAQLPMPAAVAARIDQALAAEQAQPDRRSAPVRTATVHPLRRRLPQLLAAAATVAAVAFAGYVVSTSGGADSADSATSAEGGAEAADTDESGADATGNEQRAAEPAPDGTALSAPAQRITLTEEIQAVASGQLDASGDSAAGQLSGDCGLTLARQLDTDLIGAAQTDLAVPGAVLVVVEADEPGLARGFVLPTCAASLSEVLTELTVSVE